MTVDPMTEVTIVVRSSGWISDDVVDRWIFYIADGAASIPIWKRTQKANKKLSYRVD